jgi:hypothetical protein
MNHFTRITLSTSHQRLNAKRRWLLGLVALAGLSCALIVSACGPATRNPGPSATATATQPMTATERAQQAYIYGYPLVLMQTTERVMTNVAMPDPVALKAPVGQFVHAAQLPTPASAHASSPNVDTLMSSAWLDLSAGPMVLHVPDTHGRYYAMDVFDAWTNVIAAPGARTTGTHAGDFAIAGPGWAGPLPVGVQRISSPTTLVWIVGRTQVNGPADLAAAHAIQLGDRLTPLAAWGKAYAPPAGKVDHTVDLNTPPVDQVAHMDATTFFNALAFAMKTNPPAPADSPMQAQLSQLGIVAGQAPELAVHVPMAQQPLQQGVVAAQTQIAQAMAGGLGTPVHNWQITYGTGQYGTNYLYRAAIARAGLGTTVDADTLYGYTQVDSAGKPLSGAHQYMVHFGPYQSPPVNAFWSVTMYGADHLLVDNPLKRYAIGQTSALHANPDGSLDLYVQQQSPGSDKEANWLPAPGGTFTLALRLYSPKPAALNGTWAPPALVQVVPTP